MAAGSDTVQPVGFGVVGHAGGCGVGAVVAPGPVAGELVGHAARARAAFQCPHQAGLARLGDGQQAESFFARNPGRALALRFRIGRQSAKTGEVFVEAEPEVSLVEVADREAWRRQLWALNQPENGERRPTILLHQPEDLRRLKLAMATQNTILNNGGVSGVSFDRWLPGRLVHLQEVAPGWERLLQASIAQYFFFGEFYYPAFMQEFEAALDSAERELKRSPQARALIRDLP